MCALAEAALILNAMRTEIPAEFLGSTHCAMAAFALLMAVCLVGFAIEMDRRRCARYRRRAALQREFCNLRTEFFRQSTRYLAGAAGRTRHRHALLRILQELTVVRQGLDNTFAVMACLPNTPDAALVHAVDVLRGHNDQLRTWISEVEPRETESVPLR